MPKKVVSFFPRRKEGGEPDGRLTRQISVSYDDLEALFHLPLKDAAREMNLCATTFKKACRSFGMETWPFRKGQPVPVARMTAPTLQTPKLHQASRAVMVSCTSPVWHDASSERRDTSSFGFPRSYSSVASSSSNVTASSDPKTSQDSLNPFSTVFSGPMALDTRSYGEARHAGQSFPVSSSAAPQGLLQASTTRDTRSYVEAQHADSAFPSFSSSAPSMALDTRSYVEARHSDSAFPSFSSSAPSMALDTRAYVEARHSDSALPFFSSSAPSMDTRSYDAARHAGSSFPGFPNAAPQGLEMAHPRSFSAPIDTAPPREVSCVEAVMDYLEGPLVGDFESVFVDEEGAPEVGASLDGDDND
jgi:hypothetical protein